MSNSWIFVGLLLLSSFAPSQSRPGPGVASGSTVIRAADLRADVAVLRRAYEELHPGLYRYSSKAQMDGDFDELQAQLNHDQSLEDAYIAFSLFAAKVRCGHTYANFFNQPKAVAEQLFKSNTRVPFYFNWIDRQMVVTEDFTPNHALPRGTRVLAVNGTGTPEILARLMTIARADGSNDAKRVASLAVNGDSVYETFDVFYPMFFPQSSAMMKLQLQKPGSAKAETVAVKALTYDQRIAPIKQREEARKGGDAVQFEWKYLGDGSAYLRMPTWALYDSKWDWKKWLQAHLDEIADRKSPALILDLRGNEGGQDVGNVILSRLLSGNVELSNLRRLVRYRKVPDDLAPYLDTWDPSFRDWDKAAVEMSQPWPTAPAVHYFLLKKYDDDEAGDRIAAEGKHYSGRVFVLVDPNNSSATFQFAQIVQQQKLGTLVGEPTGGSQRGINGGAFFFLRLPNSKIEMDLPLIGTFPQADMPDAGIVPDARVETTPRDIAQGHDAVMAEVEKLIHSTGSATVAPQATARRLGGLFYWNSNWGEPVEAVGTIAVDDAEKLF